MKELVEQLKKLSTKVTHFRNQNNQSYKMCRGLCKEATTKLTKEAIRAISQPTSTPPLRSHYPWAHQQMSQQRP